MQLDEFKQQVLEANLAVVKFNLVTLTWGNVSGIDRSEGLIVIKPSGVEYEGMTVDDMVVVDLDGKPVSGKWNPSSDTETHVELYKAFPSVGGITHTHSTYATIFAQALKEIPCLGTTHADHFNGPIPITRMLSKEEVASGYERNTGKVIVETFMDIDPQDMPAVLVAGHAPFAWGKHAMSSVKHSLILEKVAELVLGTLQLKADAEPLPGYILDKHYSRKHGPNSYYGQKPRNEE